MLMEPAVPLAPLNDNLLSSRQPHVYHNKPPGVKCSMQPSVVATNPLSYYISNNAIPTDLSSNNAAQSKPQITVTGMSNGTRSPLSSRPQAAAPHSVRGPDDRRKFHCPNSQGYSKRRCHTIDAQSSPHLASRLHPGSATPETLRHSTFVVSGGNVAFVGKSKRYVWKTDEKNLGSGYTSVVHRGWDLQERRAVAVKIAPKAKQRLLATDQYYRGLYRRLPACAHPNLLHLHDFLEDANNFYIISELCKGSDLVDYVLEFTPGTIPIEISQNLVFQILSGLHRLHSDKILHRDIKLDNILFEDHNRTKIKIIDFDMGLLMDVATPPKPSSNPVEVSIVGTKDYMAPECYQGQYDTASDLWSLGIIIFIFLDGHFPFNFNTIDPNSHSEAHAIVKRGVSVTPALRRRSPVAVDLMERLLKVDPAERMQSTWEALAHPWFVPTPRAVGAAGTRKENKENERRERRKEESLNLEVREQKQQKELIIDSLTPSTDASNGYRFVEIGLPPKTDERQSLLTTEETLQQGVARKEEMELPHQDDRSTPSSPIPTPKNSLATTMSAANALVLSTRASSCLDSPTNNLHLATNESRASSPLSVNPDSGKLVSVETVLVNDAVGHAKGDAVNPRPPLQSIHPSAPDLSTPVVHRWGVRTAIGDCGIEKAQFDLAFGLGSTESGTTGTASSYFSTATDVDWTSRRRNPSTEIYSKTLGPLEAELQGWPSTVSSFLSFDGQQGTSPLTVMTHRPGVGRTSEEQREESRMSKGSIAAGAAFPHQHRNSVFSHREDFWRNRQAQPPLVFFPSPLASPTNPRTPAASLSRFSPISSNLLTGLASPVDKRSSQGRHPQSRSVFHTDHGHAADSRGQISPRSMLKDSTGGITRWTTAQPFQKVPSKFYLHSCTRDGTVSIHSNFHHPENRPHLPCKYLNPRDGSHQVFALTSSIERATAITSNPPTTSRFMGSLPSARYLRNCKHSLKEQPATTNPLSFKPESVLKPDHHHQPAFVLNPFRNHSKRGSTAELGSSAATTRHPSPSALPSPRSPSTPAWLSINPETHRPTHHPRLWHFSNPQAGRAGASPLTERKNNNNRSISNQCKPTGESLHLRKSGFTSKNRNGVNAKS